MLIRFPLFILRWPTSTSPLRPVKLDVLGSDLLSLTEPVRFLASHASLPSDAFNFKSILHGAHRLVGLFEEDFSREVAKLFSALREYC